MSYEKKIRGRKLVVVVPAVDPPTMPIALDAVSRRSFQIGYQLKHGSFELAWQLPGSPFMANLRIADITQNVA